MKMRGVLGLIAASYSITVECVHRRAIQELEVSKYPAKGISSSAEELVVDSVRTGDIILVRRSWYRHHIPLAFAIAAYQAYFNCLFDHAAILLIHPVSGEAFVLENLPWSRDIRCSKLVDLLRRSTDREIVLIRLNSDLPNVHPSQVCTQMNAEKSGVSEVGGMIGSILYSILQTFSLQDLNNDILPHHSLLIDTDQSFGTCICPNVKLLARCYKRLGLGVRVSSMHDKLCTKRTGISLNNVYHRNIEVVDKNQAPLLFSKENIIFRAS